MTAPPNFTAVRTAMAGSARLADRYDLDRVLERPYERGLLAGFSENLFALYSPGWGFENDSLYRTGLDTGYGMPVEIAANGLPLSPERAVWRPSHVHSTGRQGPVEVSGDKFVTREDLAAVTLTLWNRGSRPAWMDIWVDPWCIAPKFVDGMTVLGGGTGLRPAGGRLHRQLTLRPGERVVCKAALAFSPSVDAGAAALASFFAEPDSTAAQVHAFGQWFRKNIPYFACDRPKLTEIYYFRWLTYRSSIRKTPAGQYIITEFLPNVPWAGKYNAIPAAAYMHFREGRWLADARYLNDYADFWFSPGANPRLYSFPAAALYEAYLVSGDRPRLTGKLASLRDNHAGWIEEKRRENGLFSQLADRDGMEYSLGGDGFRPTINSYMYADTAALAKITALAGDDALSAAFAAEAGEYKRLVQHALWNPADGFFEVLREGEGQPAGVRDLAGYIPWVFRLPDEKYGTAFRQLFDPDGFQAPFGPTTAERRSSRFMEKNSHDCLWNGPSWPYATTQTLWAAANCLQDWGERFLTRHEYCALLESYARSQYRNGHPWIAENLDPFTGRWIVDKPRSVHYNHSCFADLIITGYVGVQPEDTHLLTVHPLADDSTAYFALENLRYRGRRLDIYYDRTGGRYGMGKGLFVFVDDAFRQHRPDLGRLSLPLDE